MRVILTPRRLERANVFGTRSLGTGTFDERNLLSFAELIEGSTFNARHVEKYVTALVGLDEAETFVRNSLDGSFRHETRTFERVTTVGRAQALLLEIPT
jgi:hypothetical protein